MFMQLCDARGRNIVETFTEVWGELKNASVCSLKAWSDSQTCQLVDFAVNSSCTEVVFHSPPARQRE